VDAYDAVRVDRVGADGVRAVAGYFVRLGDDAIAVEI
jgi:hypothetical protein